MAHSNTEPWHTKWEQLFNYSIQQHCVAYTVVAATHNTVAYTVPVIIQHEQLYDTWQPRTLAYTMVDTVRHAALWLELYNMKQLHGMRQHGDGDT